MAASPSPMVTTAPQDAVVKTRGPAHEVAPDVFLHPFFVNTYAYCTSEGLLLVDPGLGPLSQTVHDAVRGWSDLPLHTAVYTHGHADHAFGLRAWLAAGERPHIVAQENCVARFRRYQLTHGLNARINQRQFSRPKPQFPEQFDWPTLTFRDALSQRIGGEDIHYTAAMGETDDHCYVWIPGRRYLFTGDLVIWNAPNCGNPQKVQRYPRDWADALEAMAGLGAEWLFPGHGLTVHGEAAIRTLLLETAQYLRHLIDQVLERMNAGEVPEDIFHAVEPHPELSKRSYLATAYDHPKFIVRNLLRLWGGWWNGNPADLLPSTWADQAREIAALAGGAAAIVARGRERLAAGELALASHLAEWATRAEPADRAAQQLRRDIYAARLAAAGTTMEQGIYRAAMNEARTALGEEPLIPEGALFFGARESAE